MNKYLSKFFGVMFQSQQTQQIVHMQPQHSPTCPAEWSQHWQSQGQPWRTEPEIDANRQEELSKRCTIVPDTKKGIYPFRGMKLSRADVEWLLATHENGRGPVDWSNEWERQRRGLDLRGADLRNEDLHALPLTRLIGGLSVEESMDALLAGPGSEWLIHLEGADLRNTHLEGAKLNDANLENADLFEARLQAADLSWSRLNGAWLDKAHLETADLSHAWLIAANFDDAYLEGADLSQAHAEGAFCDNAHLENANLFWAYLEKISLKNAFLNNADLQRARLAGANLQRAHFEGADLRKALFRGGSMLDEDMPAKELDLARKWFHGPRWRGMEENLDQEELAELVEEFPEILPPADLSGAFFDVATQIEGAIFGESRYGWVKVVDMHWSDANLMHINWSQISRLGDEREAQQKKLSGKKKDISILLDDFAKAVRANRQLAVALQTQGLNEDASRFAYRAQVLQRKVLWKQRSFWKWLGSAILALLAGYGYRMWRILAAYLFIVLLCAGAYFVLGIYYEPHLSFLEALLTSITAFHGRVFSEPFLRPGEPQLWVTAFEAVTGLVIEGVFIAMLAQKFFGK